MTKKRDLWFLADSSQFKVKETVTKWAIQLGEPSITDSEQKNTYLRNLIVKQVAINEKV